MARLGAVQAQDYLGALWAVGLRLGASTEMAVERALAEGTVVRSWPMRGTLHLVAAADLRWLLALLGPRVVARAARRHRELGLDEATFSRCRRLLENELSGGRRLTRPQAYQRLEAAGVSTAGQRGIHILQRLSLDALLCFGPREGKQHTFVLLEEWLPPAPTPARSRGEALAELARRYFTGHGPASLADFAWWTGLGADDARAAVSVASGRLEALEAGGLRLWRAPGRATARAPVGEVQLLPGFDELLVGYQDRQALLDTTHRDEVNPGSNGMLSPTVLSGGRLVGTWRRALTRRGVTVTARPFAATSRFSPATKQGLARAALRYADFLGRPLEALHLG